MSDFRQHVRGAPPKPEWKKRADFEYKRTARKVTFKDTERMKVHSHLTHTTRTPEYGINICVRKFADKKHPEISSRQSISGSQLGEALAYIILDLSVKLGYSPEALAWGIFKAVKTAEVRK